MSFAFSVNHGCVTALIAVASTVESKLYSGLVNGTLYTTYTLSSLLLANVALARVGAKWYVSALPRRGRSPHNSNPCPTSCAYQRENRRRWRFWPALHDCTPVLSSVMVAIDKCINAHQKNKKLTRTLHTLSPTRHQGHLHRSPVLLWVLWVVPCLALHGG